MKSVQQQQYLPPFTQRVEVYQQTDFSGSETDVSTSNENLTREEKYVLQNLTRQEPQGEENNCNRSIDQSSCNTLIIHSNIHSDEILDHGALNRYEIKANNNNNSACISGNMQRNIYSVPVSPHLKRTSHSTMSSVTGYSGNYYLPSLSSPLGRSTYTSNKRIENQEGKEISRQCLDQSEVLKHFTKQSDERQLEFDFTGLPPPPEYPKVSNAETVQSSQMEKSNKLNVSWSQPELAKMAVTKMEEMSLKEDGCFNQRPKTRGRAAIESDPEAVALKNAELIEYLTEENVALKAELEIYYNKVSRLQKFDLEIQKVHISYEDLVKSSDKRERLARAIQMKLEMEIRRLQEINKDLKDQLEVAACQLTKNQPQEVADSELRREMNKRDHLIAQLITQNKELVAAKERQEIELAAQRATLQEQRTHIDILDSALTNAQANVVKLEEECRKKQAYVERVGQLQKALASLQLASDKREQMEKRLRIQLEKEIQELRAQKVGETPTVKNCKEKVDELKRQVREYEEKLMASQAEVSKWEQRYLEESAMRQIAIDAASMPKDAKIAALERTSQESERVIAQAHTDKLRHMDELHASNKRCAELEAKIKDFESKLAEKDAMIKVLQKHSIEKDVAYHNVLLRSPRHTPHPSFHAQLSTIADSTDNNGVETSSSSTVTTTTSTLSITSGSSNTLALPSSSKNSIDEQLKELESHLSKDSIIQALRAEKEKYPSHYWRV